MVEQLHWYILLDNQFDRLELSNLIEGITPQNSLSHPSSGTRAPKVPTRAGNLQPNVAVSTPNRKSAFNYEQEELKNNPSGFYPSSEIGTSGDVQSSTVSYFGTKANVINEEEGKLPDPYSYGTSSDYDPEPGTAGGHGVNYPNSRTPSTAYSKQPTAQPGTCMVR